MNHSVRRCTHVEAFCQDSELTIVRRVGYRGFILSVALLISQAALADVVRHTVIPEAFRGTWALDQEDCGEAKKSDANKGDTNKSVIVLSAATYTSSDAKCTVLWVTETAAARGPFFSAHLQCSAANRSTTSASNVLLLANGADQIFSGPAFDNLKTYRRCPAGAAPAGQ